MQLLTQTKLGHAAGPSEPYQRESWISFDRTRLVGTGPPWWCTIFQTSPCFSKTLVAAVLHSSTAAE